MCVEEVEILKHRPVIVFLGALAVGIHLTLFALPENYTYVLLYIRCLCVCIKNKDCKIGNVCVQEPDVHLVVVFVFEFLLNRNQMLAWSFLLGMVQILDFLKFHHMFGPWAIIISSLLVDLGKFMTVLFLFLIGFSMLVTAMNTPFYQLTEVEI